MKKISRIIIMLQFPFEKRDYERYGIEALKAAGFEVEVWDLSSFMSEDLFRKHYHAGITNYNHCQIFLNKADAFAALKKLSNDCFIISSVIFGRHSYDIYLGITKQKLRYAIYAVGASYPKAIRTEKKKNNHFILLVTKLKNLVNKDKIRAILSDLAFYLRIRPPDYIIAGGTKVYWDLVLLGKKTKIIWAHYPDYDIYLKEREIPVVQSNNIAVFLDSYLPFSRDWVHCKELCPFQPEVYYRNLCGFFSYIEKTQRVKVVIAAHPRSGYDKKGDFFAGRAVFKDQTARLVKECRFVITHASYSLNYAILFKRPILLITTDEIKQHVSQGYIEAMSKILGKNIINISNLADVNIDNELDVDIEAYQQYVHDHIKKSGSDEIPFWQIVTNNIKKMR